jgi:hypothetical protein
MAVIRPPEKLFRSLLQKGKSTERLNCRFDFQGTPPASHLLSVVMGSSAIQIARHSRSTVEIQRKLQPALLRLSAMISQYFMARCFYLELIADAGRINPRPA